MFSTSPKILKTSQTTLGKLLRIYRERANPRLTQSRLGELVKVSDKTIRNWEDDLSVPTAQNLRKLLQVFVEQHLFTQGQEQAEAQELWEYRRYLDQTNLFADFDVAWFEQVLNNNRPKLLIPANASNSKAEISSKPKLPNALTALIGRKDELSQLAALIADPQTRLLTLNGIGGVGKTRLALELGHLVEPDFSDGVCFVALAAIYDPTVLSVSVAQALNIKLVGGESQDELLQNFLQDKQLLLILDNFEQLIEGGALWLHNLLERLPKLKCLVTSRQLLDVSGEQTFQLEPLPTPSQNANAEQLLENASVALFLERVHAIKPNFELTNQNAAIVAALCERLEGIPLAIELAAARIQILTPSQMLDQIYQRFNLLRGQRRDGNERHRTLWTAIEWSYKLLSPELQQFFAKLAIFYGGWTLEAATVVCEEPLAMDLLTQLRQNSLIKTTEIEFKEAGRTEVRFWMLETLREFAYAQLSDAEREVSEQKYVDYHQKFAHQAQLRGPKAAFWLEKLDYEHDNLRRAICISLKHSESADAGLQISADLWRFWYIRGHLEEGRTRLSGALALTDPQQNKLVRARAFNGEGCLAWRQGAYLEAQALFEQSLNLYQELQDEVGVSRAYNNLGLVANAQSDYQQAINYHEKSLAIQRARSEWSEMALTLSNLGSNLVGLQNNTAALQAYTESLAIWRRVNDNWGLAMVLSNLADLLYDQHEFEQAKAYGQEGLELQRAMDDKIGIATSLLVLGRIELGQLNFEASRAFLEQSLELCRQAGDHLIMSRVYNELGYLMLKLNQPAQAQKYYGDALNLLHQSKLVDRLLAEVFAGLAWSAFYDNNYARAVCLWATSEGLRRQLSNKSSHFDPAEYEVALAQSKTVLGEAKFKQLWQKGSNFVAVQPQDYALLLRLADN